MKNTKTIIIATLMTLFLSSCARRHPEPFDKAKWQRTTPEQRDLMADDLVRNYIRAGQSTGDVISIAGPAESVLTNRQDAGGHILPGSTTYSWWLGSGYHRTPRTEAHGWDSLFLYIHFDDNGTVVSSEFQGY